MTTPHHYPEDPLAIKASTWKQIGPGAACRRCNVLIERGHRYYRDDDGKLIHYACRAAEDYEHAALGF